MYSAAPHSFVLLYQPPEACRYSGRLFYFEEAIGDADDHP
jgi:hypothetical protein